jgi:pimeloyl-ACP methyl ester carboxylesterase
MNIGTMPMTNTIRWACQNPLWRTAAILLMLLAVSSSDALAQRPTPKKEKEGSRAILDGTLNIKDGLKMRYRYYPGPKDESTVPVILVHGLDGRGGDFDRLARFLSSDSGGGHSVFVPDLRGHGSSTVIEPPNGGKSINIRSERLRKNDFAAMVRMDMEAAKRFLLKEHAKRALNIEGLTIIGADVGALVAVHWAARDWSWPALAGVKQGQDVQAMVLLSPAQTFKGITDYLWRGIVQGQLLDPQNQRDAEEESQNEMDVR